jgi:hypothetical protein
MAQSKTISYDDTRDVSIRILEYLIDNKYITEFENENEYEWDFHIQDVIQGEINDVLGLDIDDNFETKIEWKWTI